MHHFISQEQFLLDRIRSASYRLMELSGKLGGERPPEKISTSTERPEPVGLIPMLGDVQVSASNAVEQLHLEINRLSEILSLADPMPAGAAAKGAY